MTIWLDMLGTEVRFVETPSFGKIRIAEAGKEHDDAIIFLHGVNGHLEAYAKNLVPLSEHFHVIAVDFAGHGLSSKPIIDYTPVTLVEQVRELLEVLGLEKVHLSGESLGGWVAALFATTYPERTARLMLNTAAGIPIVSEQGRRDINNLIELNRNNINNVPSHDTVRARLNWLVHKNNRDIVNDELIGLRLAIYLRPDTRAVAALINRIPERHDDFLIPLDKLKAQTIFLWTDDNPIHGVDAARLASARVPGSLLYLMKGDSAHWPQYEQPEEFNRIAFQFFKSGEIDDNEILPSKETISLSA